MRQVAEGDDGHQDGHRQPGRDGIPGTRQRVLSDMGEAFLDVVFRYHGAQGVHNAGKIGIAVLDQVRAFAHDQRNELTLPDGEPVQGGDIGAGNYFAAHEIAYSNAVGLYRHAPDQVIDGHEIEEQHQDRDEYDVPRRHTASHQVGEDRDGQDYR